MTQDLTFQVLEQASASKLLDAGHDRLAAVELHDLVAEKAGLADDIEFHVVAVAQDVVKRLREDVHSLVWRHAADEQESLDTGIRVRPSMSVSMPPME